MIKKIDKIEGKIHHSKITFPPCKPYNYEIDENGMCYVKSYFDKNGKVRYCANPNHTHSW